MKRDSTDGVFFEVHMVSTLFFLQVICHSTHPVLHVYGHVLRPPVPVPKIILSFGGSFCGQKR